MIIMSIYFEYLRIQFITTYFESDVRVGFYEITIKEKRLNILHIFCLTIIYNNEGQVIIKDGSFKRNQLYTIIKFKN